MLWNKGGRRCILCVKTVKVLGNRGRRSIIWVGTFGVGVPSSNLCFIFIVEDIRDNVLCTYGLLRTFYCYFPHCLPTYLLFLYLGLVTFLYRTTTFLMEYSYASYANFLITYYYPAYLSC